MCTTVRGVDEFKISGAAVDDVGGLCARVGVSRGSSEDVVMTGAAEFAAAGIPCSAPFF